MQKSQRRYQKRDTQQALSPLMKASEKVLEETKGVFSSTDKHLAAQVQTDQYLEELSNAPVEVTGFTQTDDFLPLEPEPTYIRPKYGVDAATQVDSKYVFNFDEEVEPLVETLVGKVLEQSVNEVLNESELKVLRETQAHHEQKRSLQLSRLQLEEQRQLRLEREREQRVVNQRVKAETMKLEIKQRKAKQTAQVFLEELSETVLQDLVDTGRVEDPVRRDIRDVFLPWVKQLVEVERQSKHVSKQLVDCLIKETIAERSIQKTVA